MPDKRPKLRESIPRGKHAVVSQAPRDDDDLRVSWRFGDADRNGTWAWSAENISEREAHEILAFAAEMDKLTWAVCSQGWRPHRKRIDAADVCHEAQERLRAIRRDDVDHLEEFHMSGPERIWGIRAGHVFHVLWWDPGHTVYPSDRD